LTIIDIGVARNVIGLKRPSREKGRTCTNIKHNAPHINERRFLYALLIKGKIVRWQVMDNAINPQYVFFDFNSFIYLQRINQGNTRRVSG